MTNTDKITNASIMLELYDSYSVEMCRLSVKRMADLDAYVRGKFIKNTLDAIEDLDVALQDKVTRNLALAAQQMTWIDKAATVIFESEVDGLAYLTYKYVEEFYKEGFNSWKERFNVHREENYRLFLATRYALYCLTNRLDGKDNDDPEVIYKLIDKALLSGLALDTVLEMTPDQIAMVISDRDVLETISKGHLHFKGEDEYRAWRATQQQAEPQQAEPQEA